MNVPSQDEFDALKAEVLRLQRQVGLLIEQQPSWLSVQQATVALNCSRTTLHRLTARGTLTPRYEGSKPLYHAGAIRDYIISTCVSDEYAERRVINAQMG